MRCANKNNLKLDHPEGASVLAMTADRLNLSSIFTSVCLCQYSLVNEYNFCYLRTYNNNSNNLIFWGSAFVDIISNIWFGEMLVNYNKIKML